MNIEESESLQAGIAKVISFIFHPLLMPVYGLLVVFTAPTLFWYLPFKVKEILFFIMLINNVLIPISLMPFFRFRNVSGVSEPEKERKISLAVSSALYLITSIILFRLQIPVFLKAYSYSVTVLSVFLLFISLRWQISLHSAGAGAMAALILVLSLKMASGLPWFLGSSVIISGMILSSRLKLNTNNPLQVYTGFGSGFLILGSFMLIFQ